MKLRTAPIAALVVCLAACAAAPPLPTTGVATAAPTLAAPATGTPATVDLAAELRAAVRADEIAADLEALDRIAQANGGTRAAGTPGYDASVEYVASQLRDAGWQVGLEQFDLPYFEDPATSTLVIDGDDGTWTVERDFRPLIYSAAGEVRGRVVAIDGGCAASDFDDAPRNAVLLTLGGGCFRRQQVENAQRAGAVAIITATDRERDLVLRPTLLDPDGIEIPALGASRGLTAALKQAAERRDAVTLSIDVSTEQRTAANVIADSPGTESTGTVMLGAHLDSVIDGPGINDNGSGSALVLELAKAIGERPHRAPIRVAFWAGEELGILGSTHHVESLTARDRDAIAIYLNFDMVGSPNPGRWVYADDTTRTGRDTTQRFLDWFEAAGLAAEPLDLGGGSDHAAFARVGIPTGGLFSGASERMTDAQATEFGAHAGEPADACYHLACDTASNVSRPSLDAMADAAATVLAQLAGLDASEQ